MAMRDMKVKRQTVGYLLKTYPKVSETFILQEILDLEALGLGPGDFFPPASDRYHRAQPGQASPGPCDLSSEIHGGTSRAAH